MRVIVPRMLLQDFSTAPEIAPMAPGLPLPLWKVPLRLPEVHVTGTELAETAMLSEFTAVKFSDED